MAKCFYKTYERIAMLLGGALLIGLAIICWLVAYEVVTEEFGPKMLAWALAWVCSFAGIAAAALAGSNIFHAIRGYERY